MRRSYGVERGRPFLLSERSVMWDVIILVVLSSPVEGREDEYNEWYSNVHLREVVEIR